MDKSRRRELVDEYRQRKPDMGIIALRCAATGDLFLDASKDTERGFNRHVLQLDTHTHPNKRLQALWDEYGADGFERYVYRVHEYDDPAEDQTDALNQLLRECLDAEPGAQSIRPLRR